MNTKQNEVNPSKPMTEVSRTEARKLSRLAKQPREPYRGYGHELPDGRFVCCAPDGKFYVRSSK